MPGQRGKLLALLDGTADSRWVIIFARFLITVWTWNCAILCVICWFWLQITGNHELKKKRKKIPHGFATKFTFFVCLFVLGGRLRIYYGIFCNCDRKSLIQMQVINSLYIFVHPHLPVKYHCTYTWVDISSVKTKDRGTGSQKHTGLRSSGVLILLRDRQVRRYCDGRLENCIEKIMSGLNF